MHPYFEREFPAGADPELAAINGYGTIPYESWCEICLDVVDHWGHDDEEELLYG